MTTAILPFPEQTPSLERRVEELELELQASKDAVRRAYSALLEQSMDAVLEDGTPVLSLAFAHDEDLRRRLENVFIHGS